MSAFYPLKEKAVKLAPLAGADHARDARDPRVRDGGGNPLTRTQKSLLSQLARKAAAAQGAPTHGGDHDEWRRDVCVTACGLRISEAKQRHYATLKAAFLMGMKEHEKALKTFTDDADNARRVAMFKLQKVLEKKELPLAYAENIAFTQFKRNLCQLSAKEIWCLFFTVTNRKNERAMASADDILQ